MSNLISISHLPQLRVILIPGLPLLYERMVLGRWVPCNHSRASGIVGVFNRRVASWFSR